MTITYIPKYRVTNQGSFTAIPSTLLTTATFTGLAQATTYDIEIVADNGSGQATSNIIQATTLSLNVSPNGTLINRGASTTINASDGVVWTIDTSVSANNGQVAFTRPGMAYTIDTNTFGVDRMIYVNGHVYSSGVPAGGTNSTVWYVIPVPTSFPYTWLPAGGDDISEATNVLPSTPLIASPEGWSVTDSTKYIISSDWYQWSILSGNVSIYGMADPISPSAAVTQLYYSNGFVYVTNGSSWWRRQTFADTWHTTTTPIFSTNGTLINRGAGTTITASDSVVWTIDTSVSANNGQVAYTRPGGAYTIDTNTFGVDRMIYVNGHVYSSGVPAGGTGSTVWYVIPVPTSFPYTWLPVGGDDLSEATNVLPSTPLIASPDGWVVTSSTNYIISSDWYQWSILNGKVSIYGVADPISP